MRKFLLFTALLLVSNYFIQAQTPGEIGPVTSIEATIPFQGYDETEAFLGMGEYQIYYDNVNGVFDNPFIVVDGFDPDDNSNTASIYNYFHYGDAMLNILDDLRDMGVDVVVLNFPNYTREADGTEIHGGADYIERNGFVLTSLIEEIKNQRVGTRELALLGPSMGGQITRYALTYMEQNGLDHETGLWISFDSPHRGANVPISLQYLVNYLAENGAGDEMIAMRDLQLNSAAAKQMLLDHYAEHLVGGEPLEQDYAIQLPTPVAAYRNTFMTTMNDLGFPNTTRNISVANGSGVGTMVESPGATIIDTNLDLSEIQENAGLNLALYFTPEADINNYVVDYIQPTYYGVPISDTEYYTYATSPDYTAGLDSAPGGTVLFQNYLNSGSSGLVTQFINALEVDAFSFIPVLSAMNIDDTNWYTPISGTETTPFDNAFIPTENQRHLKVTEANASFLMDEFNLFYESISVEDLNASNFKLIENPVSDVIRLRLSSQTAVAKLTVKIVNTTGQEIASYDFTNPSSLLNIPSPSADGYYMLSISDGNSSVVKKLVVLK